MSLRKFLAPPLFVCPALTLVQRVSAGIPSEKLVNDNDAYPAIDAYIEQQIHRLHIPGAYLAIVEGDKIVHLRGFGRARPDGKVPTQQTPFFIG